MIMENGGGVGTKWALVATRMGVERADTLRVQWNRFKLKMEREKADEAVSDKIGGAAKPAKVKKAAASKKRKIEEVEDEFNND
jgi:hypothetical protein